MELLRLVKELRGKKEFDRQMYLAQKKLDMYRQDLEKAQMVDDLKNGVGIITEDNVSFLLADL